MLRTKKLALAAIMSVPLAAQYQYYYSDVFSTINTANWTQNGWGLSANNGLFDTNANGGSLISKVINCECGEVVRAVSDDDLVEKVNRHVEQAHPELVGKMSRDDVLAMAEDV